MRKLEGSIDRAYATAPAGPDVRLIERWLDDIDDVILQRLVLRLCAAVANADGQIEHGESVVLRTAFDRWGLRPEEQALLEPLLYGLDFQVTERAALKRSDAIGGRG